MAFQRKSFDIFVLFRVLYEVIIDIYICITCKQINRTFINFVVPYHQDPDLNTANICSKFIRKNEFQASCFFFCHNAPDRTDGLSR